MSKAKVNFRGVSDGIILEVEFGKLDDVIQYIEEKINGNRNFYKGAKIVGVESEEFSIREKLEIAFLLKYKYRLKIDDEVLDEIALEEKEELEKEETQETDQQLDELGSMTKIVNRTIRSGQYIDYDGNVVIIGDVNPGAKIEAGGSIIVLGTFRGVGYAGKDGDKSAVIASYKLFPTQLRIAGMIARSSDKNDDLFTGLPEMAKIVEDKLVIEPYLPNK